MINDVLTRTFKAHSLSPYAWLTTCGLKLTSAIYTVHLTEVQPANRQDTSKW